MARIRTIKPEFWSSPDVGDVSRDARLTFIGIWNEADDHGRLEAIPAQIKATLFPYDDDVTVDEVCGWLNELARQGLIGLYASGRRAYLHVTGWESHQRIDRPSHPRCPDPDDCRQLDGITPTIQRDLARSSDDPLAPVAAPSRTSREPVATPHPPERRTVGPSERGNVGPDSPPEVDAQFDELWTAYPRHHSSDKPGGGGSRKKTRDRFLRLSERQRERALVGVKHYAQWCEATGTWAKFAEKWIAEQGWEEHQEPPKVRSRDGPAHNVSQFAPGVEEF